MYLIEHRIEVTIEETLLMWVFTITELLAVFHRTTESRTFFTIEIVEDGRIVVRRYAERFLGKPLTFCRFYVLLA